LAVFANSRAQCECETSLFKKSFLYAANSEDCALRTTFRSPPQAPLPSVYFGRVAAHAGQVLWISVFRRDVRKEIVAGWRPPGQLGCRCYPTNRCCPEFDDADGMRCGGFLRFPAVGRRLLARTTLTLKVLFRDADCDI
jgi:hypothetical protein